MVIHCNEKQEHHSGLLRDTAFRPVVLFMRSYKSTTRGILCIFIAIISPTFGWPWARRASWWTGSTWRTCSRPQSTTAGGVYPLGKSAARKTRTTRKVHEDTAYRTSLSSGPKTGNKQSTHFQFQSLPQNDTALQMWVQVVPLGHLSCH